MSHLGDVERSFSSAEKVLNVTGYVPFVSSVTGPLRALMGKIQVIVFAVLAINAYMLGQKAVGERCVTCILNGFANIVRGTVESVTLLGNLCCFIYDKVMLVRFGYTGEKTDPASLQTRVFSNLENYFGISSEPLGEW
ncbi:MAG: hypothetical protein WCP39_01950 [Chlamydiota bacterium]